MKVSKILLSLFALTLFGGAALAQDPVPLYPDNYKVLLENDRVRVLDFQLRKGAKEDFHQHPATVTYVLASFKIRFSFPDGTMKIREAKAGDVFYGEPLIHASENIGDTDAHGILVEMKPRAPRQCRVTTCSQRLLSSADPKAASRIYSPNCSRPQRRRARKQGTLNTISTNQTLTRIISCDLRFGAIRKRLRITSSHRTSKLRSKDARTKIG